MLIGYLNILFCSMSIWGSGSFFSYWVVFFFLTVSTVTIAVTFNVITDVHAVLSRVRFFVTLWTVAHQASLSRGFSRQEYWSRLPCPPRGDLPKLGPELGSFLHCRWILYPLSHLRSSNTTKGNPKCLGVWPPTTRQVANNFLLICKWG